MRVDARPEDIVLEIRDDGQGFDPAADHPGHFGLESMRSRSAQIGGRLTIESAPGQGAAVAVEGLRPRRMAPDDDGEIRVMIVDDQAVVRRGLLAFLESEPDLEVVGDADGGTQALEVLAGLDSKGRRPDVVLMDLQMEPVDGVESTRAIRSRYSDVEVVALTSFAEQDRVRGALAAGASGYLLKDAEADEIAAGIRAAHRGELRLDPTVARRLMSMLRERRKRT